MEYIMFTNNELDQMSFINLSVHTLITLNHQIEVIFGIDQDQLVFGSAHRWSVIDNKMKLVNVGPGVWLSFFCGGPNDPLLS